MNESRYVGRQRFGERLLALWSLAALLLAGCGGGGGGGGGDGAAADNSWLTLTPSAAQVSSYEGESTRFTITAVSSRVISEALNAAIVDRQGVIAADVTIVAESATRYVATLNTATSLRAGTYEPSFELRLCRDAAATCANPYPGSPWRVSLRVVVQAATNLTPLAPLAGAAPWNTYQGNARHTGYVNADVQATAFSRRWAVASASAGVAVADGRVHLAEGQRFGTQWAVRALSEHDGSQVWRSDLGTLFMMHPPAVAGGRVYAASSGHADTAFWVFDAASGAQVARHAMNSQFESYLAPTVHGGAVYTNSGSYGGLSKFDATSGAPAWFVSLNQFDAWTPAVDDSGVYAHVNDALLHIDPADGAVRWQINDPGRTFSAYSMNGAAVIGTGGLVYASSYGAFSVPPSSRLLAFDIGARRLAWAVGQNIASNPVLAGDNLLVVENQSLQARDPLTGALRWEWRDPAFDPNAPQPPPASNIPLVAVGRYAFVGLSGKTYAVDLQTRLSVWNYPAAGPMAVSQQGVLYIASTAGQLVAINLR